MLLWPFCYVSLLTLTLLCGCVVGKFWISILNPLGSGDPDLHWFLHSNRCVNWHTSREIIVPVMDIWNLIGYCHRCFIPLPIDRCFYAFKCKNLQFRLHAQFSPSCQLVESPAIGSFVRSGINLQFAGAAMSPEQFIEGGLLNPEATQNVETQRWRLNRFDGMRGRMIKMPHLKEVRDIDSCVKWL